MNTTPTTFNVYGFADCHCPRSFSDFQEACEHLGDMAPTDGVMELGKGGKLIFVPNDETFPIEFVGTYS